MKTIVALPCLLSLAGCSILESEVTRNQHANKEWDTPTLSTTADVRVITRRYNPTLKTDVVCTEPAPDVAKALSATLSATANVSYQQATGGGSVSGSSAEALAELAGRSTALLALRDLLFRSCEAYANGSIGANAYSLILARYGQLMTTLFLGEDIRGSAGAAAAISSPSLGNGNTSQGGGTSGNKTGTTGGAADAGGAAGSATPSSTTAATVAGGGRMARTARNSVAPAGGSAGGGATGVRSGSTGGEGSGGQSSACPASGTLAAGSQTTGAQGAGSQGAAGPGTASQGSGSQSKGTGGANPTASDISAVALVRANEDYFDLDLNPVNLLIVACINEFDPTRTHPGDTAGGTNTWLRGLCQNPESVQQLVKLEGDFFEQLKALKRPAPALDPTIAWVTSHQTGNNPLLAQSTASGSGTSAVVGSTGSAKPGVSSGR